jgi:hypothetical protein
MSVLLRRHVRPVVAFAFPALVVAATDAGACAVCYGNPQSPMVKGVAAGIWVMLGCIGFVLAGFAGVFLYWAYRSRHIDLYLEEGASN